MKRACWLMLLTLAACGGREAQPVAVVQADDAYKTCQQIVTELVNIEVKASKLNAEQETKVKRNAFFTATGALIYAPLLLIDPKNAVEVELHALAQRHAGLKDLAARKGCAFRKSY